MMSNGATPSTTARLLRPRCVWTTCVFQSWGPAAPPSPFCRKNRRPSRAVPSMDIVDQTVGKILDQFAIPHDLFHRWDGREG